MFNNELPIHKSYEITEALIAQTGQESDLIINTITDLLKLLKAQKQKDNNRYQSDINKLDDAIQQLGAVRSKIHSLSQELNNNPSLRDSQKAKLNIKILPITNSIGKMIDLLKQLHSQSVKSEISE